MGFIAHSSFGVSAATIRTDCANAFVSGAPFFL